MEHLKIKFFRNTKLRGNFIGKNQKRKRRVEKIKRNKFAKL